LIQSERQHLVVRVNRQLLAHACAVRGWSYHELARRARVSRPTVSAACRGRGIRPSSYYRIVKALATAPELGDQLDLIGDTHDGH
jgi:transcriptional regulator with XRE-family HTH domain